MLDENQLEELETLALSLSVLGTADAEIQATIDARKAEMLNAAETEVEDEVVSKPQIDESIMQNKPANLNLSPDQSKRFNSGLFNMDEKEEFAIFTDLKKQQNKQNRIDKTLNKSIENIQEDLDNLNFDQLDSKQKQYVQDIAEQYLIDSQDPLSNYEISSDQIEQTSKDILEEAKGIRLEEEALARTVHDLDIKTSFKNALNNAYLEGITKTAEFYSGDSEAVDIASASIYNAMLGQENIDNFVEKYKGTTIPIGVPGAGISLSKGLGTDEILESIPKYLKQKERNKATLPIIESFKQGEYLKGGAAIAGSALNILGSVAHGIATLGSGYFFDFAAENFINYNQGLADRKGKSLEKLIIDGEANTSIPMGIAGTQALAENLGLSKITKGLGPKFISSSSGTKAAGLLGSGLTEGTTEIYQGAATKYNKVLGDTGDSIKARDAFIDHFSSQEGLEEGLQGFFGGSGIKGTGIAGKKLLKAVNNLRAPIDSAAIEADIDELSVLQQNLKKARSKVAKQGIEENIKNVKERLSGRIAKGNSIIPKLTLTEINKVNNLGDLAELQIKRTNALNKEYSEGNIPRKEYLSALDGFKSTYIDAKNRIQGIAIEGIEREIIPEPKITKEKAAISKIELEKDLNKNLNILEKDFKEGIISEKEYNADYSNLITEYTDKIENIKTKSFAINNNIKNIKESSIEASQKLQKAFDDGVVEGDITKEKKGTNIIGDKSMKKILDTQKPFIKQLSNQVYNSIPQDLREGSKNNYEKHLQTELLDLVRTYDGSIPLGAWLQKFMPKRAISRSALKGIAGQQFTQDLANAEVKGMIAEEDAAITPEIKNIETAKDLNINKNLLGTIKDVAKKALLTAQEKVDNIKFKSDIAKSFKDALYSTIKKELGLKNTKKNPGLTKAITTNPVPFYDALSVESMRMARAKDGKNPFEEAGFLVRNKEGVLEKKKYTPELGFNFLDYFTDPNLGTSTRSDRQMNLVEALAVSMGAREAISLLENDIDFRQRFAEQQQEEQNKEIAQKAAEEIDPSLKILTPEQQELFIEVAKPSTNSGNIHKIFGIPQITIDSNKDIRAVQKQVLDFIKIFRIPSWLLNASQLANFGAESLKRKKTAPKYYVLFDGTTVKGDFEKINKNGDHIYEVPKKYINEVRPSRGGLYSGKKSDAWLEAFAAAKENDKYYKTPALKRVAIPVKIKGDERAIEKFLEKNQDRFKDNQKATDLIMNILDTAVNENGAPIELASLFITSALQATNGWIKISAPIKYIADKFKHGTLGRFKEGIKSVEEHTPPAKDAGLSLVGMLYLNKVKELKPLWNKAFFQALISKFDDQLIFAAKLNKSLPPGKHFFSPNVGALRYMLAGMDLNALSNVITKESMASELNISSPNTIDGVAASNAAGEANSADQVENLIDRAIAKLTELTGTEGTLQMNLANIPVQTIIGALRAVKLAYQGGKTLAQAIEKGYDKIKNYMSTQEWADFVSQSTQEVRNQNNPADVKLAILSEKGVAQMQEQSRKTDNALLKEFGIEIDGLSTDQIVEKLNILRKAKSEASNPKNPIKKARVFDFDDTLAKTDSKVLYALPDGTEGSLNATEFAEQYESLKESGATFDYSEFNKVEGGTKGPLATLAKRFTEAAGDRDVFVVTARPAEAAGAIQEFLRSTLGIGIPLKNISGIENGTPGAKALWVAEKVSEGYNDIFFADDSKSNVDAVENMLTDLGVTKRVQQAKETGQKTLEDEMDTLIRTNKRSKIGTLLNKLNIYVPPGADDFAGLLQYFIGKGKAGEQQQKWFQDNLLIPFSEGINAYTSAKVALASDFKALKKRFKNKKLLNEKVLGDLYTKEQAVRAYLYDKAGQDLGLNKADSQDLVALVDGNSDLKAFAEELSKITKLDNGYPNITKEWLGGNIGTDMAVVSNIAQRREFLQEFINNKNQIFSDQNLKLIKQAYGNDFTNALENVLERMTTGQNRKKGKDKEFNSVMNWINQSVGAVMAVNMRSAVLQQLSLVNYTNWSFNNPFMMAKAMANVPQFLKDYAKIWNSPFLKERRGGMAIEVNMADIADSNPGNLFLRINKRLLELGFKPTQWGDSNAISFGGASWYRNRINQLLKQGLSEKEAENQTMLEFQELSEETQQSSRVDRVSRQQSSDIGRLILAFANTPLQYARLTKKAALDLANGRGDWKTNASKILYYGIAQNLIFTALQQGLFSLLIGDDTDELDEKEERKISYAINGVFDGMLRGMGYAGATIAALKNLATEYYSQYEKRKAGKYVRDGSLKLIQKGLSISPPLSKKIGDIVEAQKFETWRQYKNDPFYQGFATANYVSGLTNVPADRVFKKIENLKAASDDKTEAWQSIFLALGWSPYNVGVQWPEMPPKKTTKKTTKKKKVKKKKVKKKKSPIKMELPQGILGRANKDGTIEIKKGLSKEKEAEVEAHEKAHLLQFKTGKLDYNDEYIRWKNQQALRTADSKIFWNGKLYEEGDRALPWEIEANKLSKQRTV